MVNLKTTSKFYKKNFRAMFEEHIHLKNLIFNNYHPIGDKNVTTFLS